MFWFFFKFLEPFSCFRWYDAIELGDFQYICYRTTSRARKCAFKVWSRPAILKMGRKRKRGQTKQSWGATNTRRQKKRRKTRGHGLNQAKFSTNSYGSKVKLSNTTDCEMLELISREKASSSGEITSSTFSPDKGWTFRGISTMFSRLHTIASMFQRSTMDCFRSIRNVFLLLNWLKRLFGCGLQTLGKVSWRFCTLCVNRLSSILLLFLLFFFIDFKSSYSSYTGGKRLLLFQILCLC